MKGLKDSFLNESFLKNLIKKQNFQFQDKLLRLLKKTIIIMNSSKGRDKICGMIQYVAKLIALTAINSNIEGIKESYQNKEMKAHLIAFRTFKTFSQARKIFRFLKFIDALEDILLIGQRLENSSNQRLFLALFAKISSFFYYIHDNILFFVNSEIFRYFYK